MNEVDLHLDEVNHNQVEVDLTMDKANSNLDVDDNEIVEVVLGKKR